MADVNPVNRGHMHFSSDGYGVVTFERAVTNLYLTTSSSTTISFDGGNNYMLLADTTHVFPHPHTKKIIFGIGTWAGVGIAV